MTGPRAGGSPPHPEAVLRELIAWVEQRDYTGFDPYDGLNATTRQAVHEHPVANTLVTQIFKHLPVNARPALGMRETKMPKSIGIFLTGYALLAERARGSGDEITEQDMLRRCSSLVDWLAANVTHGYSGATWNFGFHYKFMADRPTVVITAIIARGLFAYYRLTGDPLAERLLRGACDFVLNDLEITETAGGISFSYSPRTTHTPRGQLRCCYNASMLGAEILAMGYAFREESRLRALVKRALDFVVEHQRPDGRWNYSLDLATGRERKQVDFHQGYLIDSIAACMRHAELPDQRYAAALGRATEFYRSRQFTPDGRALWRLPRAWPADIHCQAQGIITFSKLASVHAEHRAFAETIAHWTLRNMWSGAGFFHYRKGRLLRNRIPYMRWGQAWMMLALAQLLAGVENVATAGCAR